MRKLLKFFRQSFDIGKRLPDITVVINRTKITFEQKTMTANKTITDLGYAFNAGKILQNQIPTTAGNVRLK